VCPGAGRGLYLRSPDRFRVRANTGPSLTRFALAAILCAGPSTPCSNDHEDLVQARPPFRPCSQCRRMHGHRSEFQQPQQQ
jgi:hypothetical protein